MRAGGSDCPNTLRPVECFTARLAHCGERFDGTFEIAEAECADALPPVPDVVGSGSSAAGSATTHGSLWDRPPQSIRHQAGEMRAEIGGMTREA